MPARCAPSSPPAADPAPGATPLPHPASARQHPAMQSPRPGGPAMARPMVIAIDGPAGAGKSTVTRLLAQRLKLLFLDTGAMYRAATVGIFDAGIDVDDPQTVE